MNDSKSSGGSTSDDAHLPSYWINNRGYAFVSDGEKIVSIHQLLAIAEGADPHEVFSDETEVHHELASGEKLNHPNNLRVVTRIEHRRLHRNETPPASPEQVLFPEDADPASAEKKARVPSHAD